MNLIVLLTHMLMMQAVSSSITSVNKYQTTRCNMTYSSPLFAIESCNHIAILIKYYWNIWIIIIILDYYHLSLDSW